MEQTGFLGVKVHNQLFHLKVHKLGPEADFLTPTSLCSTHFVYSVLNRVGPKTEIRSSGEYEENLRLTGRLIPARSMRTANQRRGKSSCEQVEGVIYRHTVVPLGCNKEFERAKYLEERKQKNWSHLNFNFAQKFHPWSKNYSESLAGNSIFLQRSSASASRETLLPQSSARHVGTVVWNHWETPLATSLPKAWKQLEGCYEPHGDMDLPLGPNQEAMKHKMCLRPELEILSHELLG